MNENNDLLGILSGDRAVLEHLYVKNLPIIRHFVQQSGGTEDDAKDLFQDAIIVLYHKAKQPDFMLTSQFGTFFYGLCRNLWRSRCQKKSNSEVRIPDDAKYIPDDATQFDFLWIERHKLYHQALLRLGEDCQKLLQLFFQQKSMAEIAQEMGYGSEGYAARRKFMCKERLIKIIKSDPCFPELQDD